ncbi:MAG: glycosyltransferase family 9 protein [Bdellovibrionaceae bacterium]|nr:glycosyltransferase family 9 protein [Pseudobdellovibrionaceae bacterium]
MKILVLSLLRLGDTLQQAFLFKALREKCPQAKIYVVVNSVPRGIEKIIPEVDHWILFERSNLQAMIGEKSENIFSPILSVRNFITKLNQISFDVVYNFTHNRLSALIAGMVEAVEYRGLVWRKGGYTGLENLWLRQFNNEFSERHPSPLHYVEYLANAFDLPIRPLEAKSRSGSVLIQPLTSDPKKNWGLSFWRALVDELVAANPNLQVRVLGAPSEMLELERFFTGDELRICDLQGARDELRRASLLITGDTSIKHLAVMEGTRVLEISMGSADPTRTGPFGVGHYILTSSADCYPCLHTSPCRKLSHLCAEAIKVKDVIQVADALLAEQEVKTEFVYKTAWVDGLGWTMVNCAQKRPNPFRVLSRLSANSSYGKFQELTNARKLFQNLFPEGLPDAGLVELTELVKTYRRLSQLSAQLGQEIVGADTQAIKMAPVLSVRNYLSTLRVSEPTFESLVAPMRMLAFSPSTSPLQFVGLLQRRVQEFGLKLFFHLEIAGMNSQGADYGVKFAKPSDCGFEAP